MELPEKASRSITSLPSGRVNSFKFFVSMKADAPTILKVEGKDIEDIPDFPKAPFCSSLTEVWLMSITFRSVHP